MSKTKFQSFITSSYGRRMCRKSDISSLAKIHGRSWTAVEANSLQCGTVGEPVQRPDITAVSGQAKVPQAVPGGAREGCITIRSRESIENIFWPLQSHAMHQQVLRSVLDFPWTFHRSTEKLIFKSESASFIIYSNMMIYEQTPSSRARSPMSMENRKKSRRWRRVFNLHLLRFNTCFGLLSVWCFVSTN